MSEQLNPGRCPTCLNYKNADEPLCFVCSLKSEIQRLQSTLALREEELAKVKTRLEDVYVKDSVKTKEINVLVQENRHLKKRADAQDEYLAAEDSALASAQQRLRSLEEAGKYLVNEVAGIIGIEEPSLRQLLGNTNFNCLTQRWQELRALLHPAPPQVQPSEEEL